MPTDGPWSGTRLQSSLRCQTERKSCAQRKEEYSYQQPFPFKFSAMGMSLKDEGKKMLAANCILILEAFQPRAYPRINSLLSTSWRKNLYVFQKMSQICLNTACSRITSELCILFHMSNWNESAAEGQFILWHHLTNHHVINYKIWLNNAFFKKI